MSQPSSFNVFAFLVDLQADAVAHPNAWRLFSGLLRRCKSGVAYCPLNRIGGYSTALNIHDDDMNYWSIADSADGLGNHNFPAIRATLLAACGVEEVQ